MYVVIILALIGAWALVRWDADYLECIADFWHIHMLVALFLALTFGSLNAILVGQTRRSSTDPLDAANTPGVDRRPDD
ncbi:MAG: hypothetical protein ACYTKD_13075 [Planctomycetota bacterium]